LLPPDAIFAKERSHMTIMKREPSVRTSHAVLPEMKDITGMAGMEELSADLCVIGAGSGGLSVAAAAAQLGSKVILIEKHKMGGDCLNYGCVPSKAMLAAGRRAHAMRTSGPFGIAPVTPTVDPAAVNDHVRRVVAAIAPNDSVERFTGLGVHVIQAAAKFIDPKTVVAGDHRIKARRFVIATGSSPSVPPIADLNTVPYFTNETLFENRSRIGHLIIIGAGPIGMEMAQAHHRLGAEVTVLDAGVALAKDDPELSSIVLKALRTEGIVIREGVKVERVTPGAGQTPGRVRVHIFENGQPSVIEGTHLLVAAGRAPNVANLGLEAANIKYDKRGIAVNRKLVTSNRKVFAIGDVTGGLQFTHMANYHAGIVIRRALFRMPATVQTNHVPWVTFTEPELAHIGVTEETARKSNVKVRVFRWPYHENDRAQAERATEGLIKVVTDSKGKILGTSIAGQHAGEVIQMWSLAVAQGLNIRAMTQWISPYPTISEISKRVAFGYYTGATANPLVQTILRWVRKFG
jgi:pyruvate/2-oxoglutarate dehydrogenase complex dihydrolipoamide dehydrogenase (E3) component